MSSANHLKQRLISSAHESEEKKDSTAHYSTEQTSTVNQGNLQGNTPETQPYNTRRRSRFFWVTGIGEGRYCGTSGLVLCLRLVSITPMIIFSLFSTFSRKELRESIAVNSIRVTYNFMAAMLLTYTRLLVYVAKNEKPRIGWSPYEVFEGCVVYFGMCFVAFRTHPSDSFIAQDWSSAASLFVVCACTFAPQHILVKQIMMAQTKKLTGYTASLGIKIMSGVCIALFMSAYAFNVLTSNTSSSSTMGVNMLLFEKVAISSNYSCKSNAG